jgi:hypothetical protein
MLDGQHLEAESCEDLAAMAGSQSKPSLNFNTSLQDLPARAKQLALPTN